MSVAQAKEFLTVCSTDEDLAQAVKSAPDHEARQAIAEAKGYDFTKEEMAEAASAQAPSADGELSDDALNGVAGAGGIWISAGDLGGFGVNW